ncbi:MAG: nuclear transport factor 2 family protein [Actinomycetota bacterium]
MHPNEEVVRNFYEAFERRDMEELQRLVDPGIVYHESGRNRFTGDYQGFENMMGLFEQVGQLFEGNIEVEVHDVIGGESHVVVLENMRLSRAGRSIETKAAAVAHVENGRIKEMWELRENQQALDELIGS